MNCFDKFGKYICRITGEICENAETWLVDIDPKIGFIHELWNENLCPYDVFGQRAYTPIAYNEDEGFTEFQGSKCEYLAFKEYGMNEPNKSCMMKEASGKCQKCEAEFKIEIIKEEHEELDSVYYCPNCGCKL